MRRPYTAPERIAGLTWDRRADIFSLAALVCELMTGRRISGVGADAVASLPEVAGADPAALTRVLSKALAGNPSERFESGRAFAEALDEVFTEAEPVPARRSSRRSARAPHLPVDEPALGLAAEPDEPADVVSPDEPTLITRLSFDAEVDAGEPTLHLDRLSPAGSPAIAGDEGDWHLNRDLAPPSSEHDHDPQMRHSTEAHDLDLTAPQHVDDLQVAAPEPSEVELPVAREEEPQPQVETIPSREAMALSGGDDEPVIQLERELPAPRRPRESPKRRPSARELYEAERQRVMEERARAEAEALEAQAREDAAAELHASAEADMESEPDTDPGIAAATLPIPAPHLAGSPTEDAYSTVPVSLEAAHDEDDHGHLLLAPHGRDDREDHSHSLFKREPDAHGHALDDHAHDQMRAHPPAETAAPASAIDATRSAIWPLALALVVGIAIGFGLAVIVIGRNEPAPTVADARPAAATPVPLVDEPIIPVGSPAAAPPSASAPASASSGSAGSEPSTAVAPAVHETPPGTTAPSSSAAPSNAPSAAAPSSSAPGTAASAPSADDVRPGRLLVRSTPPGAAVTLDGKDAGVTPVSIRELARGAHTVRVMRDGYVGEERRIAVTDRQVSHTINVELQRARAERRPAPAPAPERPNTKAPAAARSTTPAPARGAAPAAPATGPGSVLVDSRPTGARVLIDGRPVGTTPLTLPSVEPGEHNVALELAQHRRWTASFTVKPGERARVAGSLERLER
jgi:hypothetical protein